MELTRREVLRSVVSKCVPAATAALALPAAEAEETVPKSAGRHAVRRDPMHRLQGVCGRLRGGQRPAQGCLARWSPSGARRSERVHQEHHQALQAARA